VLRAGRDDLQIVVGWLNSMSACSVMLRVVAGPASMLEQRIQDDAAVPEALARGILIFGDAPYSHARCGKINIPTT